VGRSKCSDDVRWDLLFSGDEVAMRVHPTARTWR
jgi:hypothetical protein